MKTSLGPAIHGASTTRRLMLLVALALLPACAGAVWRHGLAALQIELLALLGALFVDLVLARRELRDGTAVVVGLLVALMLPVTAPPWLVVLAAALAVGVGKHAFGGTGRNLFNPAVLGRAVVAGFVPAEFLRPRWELDGASFATPLAKEIGALPHGAGELLSGVQTVTLAEAAPLAVLAGGMLLLATRTIDWRLPLVYLATLAAWALLLPGGERLAGHAPWLEGNPLPHLVGGGSLLAAFFLVTDPVTMPFSPRGRALFVVLAATYCMLIRFYTPNPDGVAMGILLANLTTPLLDRWTLRW